MIRERTEQLGLSNLDPPSARDITEFAAGRLFSKPAADAASAALFSPLPLDEWQRGYVRVGNAEPGLTAGALCAAVHGGDDVALAWNGVSGVPYVSFEPEKDYPLHFRMSSSGRLPVHATVKVGCREPPRTHVVQAPIPVTDMDTSYAVDFRPSYAETRGGVAFVLSAPCSGQQSEVCLDDITLVGG